MPSDEQFAAWCRRIQASDRDAFEQVFQALHDPLIRYALRITKSQTAAQDVVQKAFIELWSMRDSLDPSKSMEALLYRIVRNRAYNHQRDQRTRRERERQAHEDRTSDEPALAAALDADRLETHLETWVDDLPERQREALLLSRFENLTHDEIAEVMEISPRTVNNHIVQALKQLRSRVRTHHPDLLSS